MCSAEKSREAGPDLSVNVTLATVEGPIGFFRGFLNFLLALCGVWFLTQKVHYQDLSQLAVSADVEDSIGH